MIVPMGRHSIGTFPYASCRYVQLTQNFDTTIPIYGVKIIPTGQYSSNNANVKFSNWYFDTWYWRVHPNNNNSYSYITDASYFFNVGGGAYAMFNIKMKSSYEPFYFTRIGTPSTCPYSQIWLLVGDNS